MEHALTSAVVIDASCERSENREFRAKHDKVTELLRELATLDVEIDWLPHVSKRKRELLEMQNRAVVESLDRLASFIAGSAMDLFVEVIRNELGAGYKRALNQLRAKAVANVVRAADTYASLLQGISEERANRAKFEPAFADPGTHRGSVPFEL